MKKILSIVILITLYSFIFASGLHAAGGPQTPPQTTDPTCYPGCTEPNPGTFFFCGLVGWQCNCVDTTKRLTGVTVSCYEPGKTYCPPSGEYYYSYDSTSQKCVRSDKTATYLCVSGSCQTAIGTVPTNDLAQLLKFVLRWVFYASGAVILIMIIATGYMVITGSGNPEKLQAAQENIVALFSGLALIVFSLVLLQAIGAGILGLPGF